YPWFFDAIMFLGMSIAIIPWRMESRKKAKMAMDSLKESHSLLAGNHHEVETANSDDEGMSIAPEHEEKKKEWTPLQENLLLAIPTVFDLMATGLGCVAMGIYHLPASIYQMLGASIMVFTALVSIPMFKRLPSFSQVYGIILCIIGLTVVTWSSFKCGGDTCTDAISHIKNTLKDDQASTSDLVMGTLLVLLSQLIYAGQFVVEETALNQLTCTPYQVVGMEGAYGFVMMAGILCPIFAMITPKGDGGFGDAFAENDMDALRMIAHNPWILVPLGIFFFAILTYNIFGQTVTSLLTATHRTILEALRGLAVWVLGVALYYVSGGSFGEALCGMWSLVELVGFAITVFAAMVFYDILKIPTFLRASSWQYKDEITENAVMI
ncbi:hypothetical protein KIPB_008584, partial [Kipferlia bialata]